MKHLFLFILGVGLVMLPGEMDQAAFAQSASQFSIRNMDNPPQLDGVRGSREWRRATLLDCSPESAGLSANTLGQSALETADEAGTNADASADIRFAWDEDALYFIAEVRDNMHDVSGTGGAEYWWERDGISLYVDLVNGDASSAFTSEAGGPYTAVNIINFMAAAQNSSAETITLEYTGSEGERVSTQDPADIAGLEYVYRDAGTEFGGSADYAIEGKVPWETLMRLNLTKAPSPSDIMGLSILVLDPDGEDGYGGQLQCWGMAGSPATYSDLVFKGPVMSANKAGGYRGRFARKPIVPGISSWGAIKKLSGELEE